MNGGRCSAELQAIIDVALSVLTRNICGTSKKHSKTPFSQGSEQAFGANNAKEGPSSLQDHYLEGSPFFENCIQVQRVREYLPRILLFLSPPHLEEPFQDRARWQRWRIPLLHVRCQAVDETSEPTPALSQGQRVREFSRSSTRWGLPQRNRKEG